MYARLRSLATLLAAALGASVSVDNGGWFTHTFTPAGIDDEHPWLSIEEAIGQSLEVSNHSDARVNTLHLESDVNGHLMVNVGLAAISSTAGNTRTDLQAAPGLVDITPLFTGVQIDISIDGGNICAKNFSFDINNNMELDDFCMGKIDVDTFTPKSLEVTAGMSYRPDDASLFRQAVWGSAAAAGPLTGPATTSDLVITMTNTSLIDGTAQPLALRINIPNSIIEPFTYEPSSDDIIESCLLYTSDAADE